MTAITRTTIEKSYEKLMQLPQEKLVLVLQIIDQFAAPVSGTPVRLGIADGKYHIPDDINEYDDQIAELFGV